MGFVIVFALAAGMAVFAISVALVAASLGLAAGAFRTGLSGGVSRKDLAVLGLGAVAFYLMVFSFFEAQTSGRESFWDMAILAYMAFIFTALALSAVAVLLRTVRRIGGPGRNDRLAATLPSAITICLGFGAAYTAIALTGDFFLFKVKKAPPLELVVDGEPTHCVYATSGVQFYKIRSNASQQLYRLKQGQKVQLNTSAFKAGDGWVRFEIADGDRRFQAYALGSGIVALNSDGSCILPK